MKKFLAVFALIPALAFGIAPEDTRALFDSSTVNSGATWTSSALVLNRITHVEVFADNTSGSGFRDLTMTSYYDPKCVTTMDSVLLRRIAWGTAANSAGHAPGRVRGYIGPQPPGSSAGSYVLFDGSSTANAAVTTPALVVEDADAVAGTAYFNGGSGTAQPSLKIIADDDTAVHTAGLAALSAAGSGSLAMGPGIGGPADTSGGKNHAGGLAVPTTRRIIVSVPAAGGGVITRLIVQGRGRLPGTFTHQMVLPVCAKFSLSAANGTIRLWGIGR